MNKQESEFKESEFFERIVHERYAAKLFDGKIIPESKVSKLMELIQYAASSFNIQPWKVIVITSPEIKEKLSPVSWNQPQVKSCSHLLVLCANTDVKGNIKKLEDAMIKNGADREWVKGYVQMMLDFEKKLNDEQKLEWAQRQVYLALANALNGAKALGFDSCPMEGFDSSAYSKILKLPDSWVPTVLCPIGYAADKQKSKLRFDIGEIFMHM